MRYKKKYVLWLSLVLVMILGLCACGTGTSDSSTNDSTPPASADETAGGLKVDGVPINDDMALIEEDSFIEKLVSFGFTESEAADGAALLKRCGVPSIDACEPTDTSATIDGLVAFRDRIDDDRVFWFTVENRKIFYVALNGEDLYDEYKGGFLKTFDEVHIPETSIDEATKRELLELAEATLDKYFGYGVCYYDAWGVGREDDNYMVQCQISDGSIITDYWIFGRVWFEWKDNSFVVMGVRIGDTQYEVK